MTPEEHASLLKEAHDLRNTMRTSEAIVLYTKLLEYDRSRGEHQLVGEHLQMIGVCYKIDNETDLSLEFLDQAIAHFRTNGLKKGEAAALRDKAITYEYADRLEVAHTLFEESLNLYRRIDDPGGQGITLAKFGNLLIRLGRYEEAERALTRSIEQLKQTSDWFFLATTYGHLAHLRFVKKEWEPAIELLLASKALFDAHPEEAHTRRYAQMWGGMAHCYAQLGDFSQAKECWEKSMHFLYQDQPSEGAAAKVLKDMHAEETKALLGLS